MQHAPTPGQNETDFGRILLAAILMVWLTVTGGIFLFMGTRAIQTRSWVMTVNAPRTPPGSPHIAGGTSVGFQGADGIRAGVGLAALGTMFWDWTVLLLWSFVERRGYCRFSRVLRVLLGGLSFACLTIGLGAFFPPWDMHAMGFWGVVLLVCLAPPCLVQIRRDSWILPLFATLIAVTIITKSFSDSLSLGMFLALIGSAVGFVHLNFLVAAIRELLPDRKTMPAAVLTEDFGQERR